MGKRISQNVVDSINSVDLGQSDFTVTEVQLDCWGIGKCNQGGFVIDWKTKSAGFGSTTVYLKDGKIKCDNESMSKEFIKSVFMKLIDNMEFLDEV